MPLDFADPAADYRSVRAPRMAPFHGHAVPPHVTVTDAEFGGVRCAWYDDARVPGGNGPSSIAMAARSSRARWTTTTSMARSGGAARRAGRHRRLPAGARASLSRGARRLPRCIQRAGPQRRGGPGSPRGQWRLVRRTARPGHAGAARDQSVALPAGFVSVSGWFDLSVADETTSRGRDPFLTAAWVRNRGRDYTAGRVRLDDPRVSPRYADLRWPAAPVPAGGRARHALRGRGRAGRGGSGGRRRRHRGVMAGRGTWVAGSGERRSARGVGRVCPCTRRSRRLGRVRAPQARANPSEEVS